MNLASRFAPVLLVALGAVLMTVAGCKDDETPTNGGGGGTTVVPITDDVFPLTVGRSYTYAGYSTDADSGYRLPDPGGVYRSKWTIATNSALSPLDGQPISAIVDSTTGPYAPGGGAFTVARTLLIRKDSVGDYHFVQTIGPFKRRVGLPTGTTAADTLISVAIVRPTQGVGGTGAQWTAYDQTFTSGGAQIRLQIFGKIEETIAVADSASPPVTRTAYRARTWRRVSVNGTPTGPDATTAEFWLVKDIGPVQMRIVEDGENFGHFRTMRSKNF